MHILINLFSLRSRGCNIRENGQVGWLLAMQSLPLGDKAQDSPLGTHRGQACPVSRLLMSLLLQVLLVKECMEAAQEQVPQWLLMKYSVPSSRIFLFCADLEAQISAKMCKANDLWQCGDCLWTTKYKTRLWEHIESKHVSSHGYTCPICSKFCPSKNAWHHHKSRYHKGMWNHSPNKLLTISCSHFAQLMPNLMLQSHQRWASLETCGNVKIVCGQLVTGRDCGNILKQSMSNQGDTTAPYVSNSAPPRMLGTYTKADITRAVEIQVCKSELRLFSLGALWEEIQKRIFPLSDLQPGSTRFGCTDCNHTSRDKHAMSLHIESKHVGSSGYTCPICSKFCPSRNAWHLHKSRYHKGLWFQTLSISYCGLRCTRIQKEWTAALIVTSSPRYQPMWSTTLNPSMLLQWVIHAPSAPSFALPKTPGTSTRVDIIKATDCRVWGIAAFQNV